MSMNKGKFMVIVTHDETLIYDREQCAGEFGPERVGGSKDSLRDAPRDGFASDPERTVCGGALGAGGGF